MNPPRLNNLWQPFQAQELFNMLRGASPTVRRGWWAHPTTSNDQRLWWVSRVNPLEGFSAARRVWLECFNREGAVSPTFLHCMELLEDFVSRGGKLPKHANPIVLDQMAYALKWEEEPYSECTFLLVQALAYAAQVNHNPGWYPPTAFEVYRATKRNEPYAMWDLEYVESALRPDFL